MKNLLFLTALTVTSVSYGQSPVMLHTGAPVSEHFSPERLARIDTRIRQYIDSGWLKGANALIARNGVLIYNKSFGLASTGPDVPMSPGAIFRIASQTKAITSVGVMMLFEEGKLLLDDPISKYLPAFAKPRVLDQFNPKDSSYTTVAASREITIRDLLTHTSGIDYAQIGSPAMNAIYAKAGLVAGFTSEHIVLADKMAILARLPLVHQPGLKFTYGLNTDVLGYLIEKISGQTLAQYFKHRIFDPIGMKDTYFYLPAEKASRLVAVYTTNKQHELVKWTNSTFYHVSANYPNSQGTYYSGGAGLSSTIGDYAIFLQMLLNKGVYNDVRLLSPRTVEIMTSNQIGDLNLDQQKNKFGLGFRVVTRSGEATLGQSESSFSWGGFYGTTYWADPKENIIGLIFAQEWPFPHGEISDKFIAMVYQALQ